MKKMAMMALAFLAIAPAAQAQTMAEYHAMYNFCGDSDPQFCDKSFDGVLITDPNPFPGFITLTAGGQLTLSLDTHPGLASTFELSEGCFQPDFPDPNNPEQGFAFVEVPVPGSNGEIAQIFGPTAADCQANPNDVELGITTIYTTFVITFK